jgi:UDP-GlcNAc:undecaprenyl-phosphate GlcNAc-1-phosphate transferase
LALALAALAAGTHAVAGGAIVLAAASAGFLLFNLPPARIFMGDVGSLFLGFTFAGLAVFLAARDKSGLLIYVGPLVLFHFVFDTAVTFVRRLLRGENVAAAHKSHLYQRLNQSGWSHAQVSHAHYAMSLVQGACALVLVASLRPLGLLALIPVIVLQAIYAIFVARQTPMR